MMKSAGEIFFSPLMRAIIYTFPFGLLLRPTSVGLYPPARGDEFFARGVDRHDVRARRAHAAVRPERQARRQPRLVIVETFERRDELLAGHVFPAAPQA